MKVMTDAALVHSDPVKRFVRAPLVQALFAEWIVSRLTFEADF